MKLPKVNSTHGAPMGRHSVNQEDRESPKVSLQRVRLDSGGYDNGGAYWGIGEPLWLAQTDGQEMYEFFRAANREAAKNYVRQSLPQARFYR